MLYLAEVKKQKKRFLAGSGMELDLLAFQDKNYRWRALSREEKIPAEEAKVFGDGALVIVYLDANQQIQGTLEPAGRRIATVLQNFSAILDRSKNQEEKIEEWKQSLSLQIKELNRREWEMKARLEQLEQMEQEFKRLEQQYQASQKIVAHQRLGTILQQAGLVSAEQLQMALKDQTRYSSVRIGEILALRGWLKQETADFFAHQWMELQQHNQEQPLGYYLKEAALLDEEQIGKLLVEQKQFKLQLGALAVRKGWLQNKTLDFFLKHLALSRVQNKHGL